LRLKVRPEDFIVEERIRLPFARSGAYALYRVAKRGVTTLDVQARLAAMLGVPRSAVAFPALKDKDALATQYASVKVANPLPLCAQRAYTKGGERICKGGGPRHLEGPGFAAELSGRCARPLRPSDLDGNHFTVTLRDLAPQEAAHIENRLAQVGCFGVPNYFDEQRFGSRTASGDFLGERILRRDAEGALRAYLAEPLAGDPPRILAFKGFASEHWGEWGALFERAPKPSNLRSVLTFLKDHPTDYRAALNLIPQRLLSLFLAAYQSFLWNRMAGLYLRSPGLNPGLEGAGQSFSYLEVAGAKLPVHHESPNCLSQMSIPLPHLHAAFGDPELTAAAEEVLREEGLDWSDLKARILKRAYLPKGQRALLVFPQEAALLEASEDELFPGRCKLILAFSLLPGSYATLVLKALASQRPSV